MHSLRDAIIGRVMAVSAVLGSTVAFSLSMTAHSNGEWTPSYSAQMTQPSVLVEFLSLCSLFFGGWFFLRLNPYRLFSVMVLFVVEYPLAVYIGNTACR